jgi:hypothetical protein
VGHVTRIGKKIITCKMFIGDVKEREETDGFERRRQCQEIIIDHNLSRKFVVWTHWAQTGISGALLCFQGN